MTATTVKARAATWGTETIEALDWLKAHKGTIYWPDCYLPHGDTVEIGFISALGHWVHFTAPGVVVGVRMAKILQNYTDPDKAAVDTARARAFNEVVKETLWLTNMNGTQTVPIADDTTTPDQKTTVPNLLTKMRQTHDTKNKDYAGGKGDAFANFRMSEKFGIPAHMGVLVRMSDKFMRIGNLAERQLKSGEGATVKDESIYDTLLDLAVYSLIMYCLYEEWSEKNGKK